MHPLRFSALILLATLAAAQDAARDYPIRAVPFTAVKVSDAFWSPRLEINRTVTIPYCFKMCEETGRIENFDVAAKKKTGNMKGYFFNDSDVYKTIEGAAYALHNHPDPKLEALCDEVIARIAAAQEPDGYLYCSRTINDPKNPPPGGPERWSDMANGHELYCVGHMYEAAVAYQQATGKDSLLKIARKNADLVASVFGPGRNPNPCGHPEIEIGLVKLYRSTGDAKYLDLAKFFIDTRGKAEGRKLFGEYAQDHKPLLEQAEAVGHSVRAGYLYAGMADVAALTGERPYIDAIGRLWADIVEKKMYVTGGIGARGNIEGFGDAYELPNGSAYNETCAAIANALLNHRLLLTHGDAKYADVLERIIYNGFLSGWGLTGDRFFYPNPLESAGHDRQGWFACACCPPNDARFVPSIPGYIYSHRGNDLYVNLFIGGEANVPLDAGAVTMKMETRYPWDGAVKLTVEPAKPGRFALRIRVPGWARGEVTPGGLYRFLDESKDTARLHVNGGPVDLKLEKGYAVLDRDWARGDTVQLDLPMAVRRVVADERIVSNRGRVSLARGPIVYCFEGIDQPEPHVGGFVVDDATKFEPRERADLLGGVVTLVGKARIAARTLDGGVKVGEPIDAVAIPYYAWANRERTPMSVWVGRTPDAATPQPAPTIARRAKATASFKGDLGPLSDQRDPATSGDHTFPYVHWWPKKGTTEWIQYDFAEPTRVAGVEVYWFDDTGRGECRVPKSWKLLANVDGAWREVAKPSEYGVALDKYNRCTFEPVKASGLKLEITAQEKWAGGVHEWRVIEAKGNGESRVQTAVAGQVATKAPLMTRWAKDMNPDAPLPEYPRPQMVREKWQNLNGKWEFAPAKEGEAAPTGKKLDRTIVVPFCMESALSGVMEHHPRSWYRRTFEIPADWKDQRVWLHFGAVDWEATVYVNGERVGEHRGGYDAFSFDITDALKTAGPQELIVGVFDPTDDGDQPRGKQEKKPHGIWYTPTTGIWQTVWLEPTPATFIKAVWFETDALDNRVKFHVKAETGGKRLKFKADVFDPGLKFRADVFDPDKFRSSVITNSVDTVPSIQITDCKRWSPESPFLYDVQIDLLDGRTVVDSVKSYVGVRSVKVMKDTKGVNRLLLNGKPYFQVGPLDQGYWPDGIYTAPTDEALKYDIEITKRLGYNMTRKHVKVEPARWYYWADKLGLLVWQDMPSPRPPKDTYTDAGRKQFETELRAMIDSLRAHPSIVMWVVFNEGWGQFETPRFVELTRSLDPTRLVNNASGWVDAKVGDVNDIHHYPNPAAPPLEPGRAGVLGEFGGLGLAVPDHLWKKENWGYKAVTDSSRLTAGYEKMLRRVYELRDEAGLAAAVYTQITDVEIECNGLLTYDRAVVKVDEPRVAAVNRGDFSKVPPPPKITSVVATSEKTPQEWRHTFEKPAEAWARPDFDDAAWKSGPGGFGTNGTPGAVVRTEWKTKEIWLRRVVELSSLEFASPHLRVHHDEDCEVFINGVPALRVGGYTTEYEEFALSAEGRSALRVGSNTIAVHCRQTGGGQFIDVGLVDVAE